MMQEEFIDWLKLKNLSPKYVKEMAHYFRKIHTINLRREGLVQGRIDYFLSRNNHSMGRAFIKHYLTFNKRKGLDISGFDIPKQSGRKKVRKPEVLTEKEVKKIIDSMPSYREKVMVLVQYWGALRGKELINIKPNDIDWENNTLTLPESKSGEFAVIPLPDFVVECLHKYLLKAKLRHDKGIFTIGYNRYYKLLRMYSERAIGKKVKTHSLRHSFAYFCIQNGWDIRKLQEMLRHKDISSTQIYAHLDRKKFIQDYRMLYSDPEETEDFQNPEQ
jgi:integrase/recombinase XerD